MNLDNILVIIPVKNEAATIIQVIQSLQILGLKFIRIVDNGSTDNSAILAQKAGAEVVFEPVSGYGKACWRGLQEIPSKIEWILFCDGDGSDDLSQLSEFFQKREEFDLILGDRSATSSGKKVMTPVQRFGNSLASILIHLGWGYRYHDLGPLRLIRRTALEQMAMEDRGFGWTVEMQLKAIEKKLHICELPVNYYPRQGGKSKISGTISGSIKAGIIILGTLGKLYLRRIHIVEIIAGILLLLGSILILPYGDFREVNAVPHFWFGIVVMGIGFILSWKLHSISRLWFWLIAILARLILLPMYPGDDVWRYLWEGYIQNLGFSPYYFAPNASELIQYHTQWWSQINHPDVTAIYPPIAQWGFRLLASINPNVILFKLAFIGADLLTCWLLCRQFGYQKTLLYAWNPLIIYSFAGGAHYDSWFILPLVAVIGLENQLLKSALLLGISVAIKWISLPILSFLVWQALRKVGLKLAIFVLICGCLPLIISAIPFCVNGECPLIPTGSDFVSHGRSAEFFPYLLGIIWAFSRQFNWIYLFPLGLMIIFLLIKARTFREFTEGYFFSVLIFSPIIHAWYFTWIIPFAVATQNLGVKLVSLSSFVYFVLKYRQALGDYSWSLTDGERVLLWLPFLLGWMWTKWKVSAKS